MAPTTFFSLPPEVIYVVGIYLDQHSLAQCLLVCHEWTTLFTPSFWRVIRISDGPMTTCFTTRESLAALTRNKQHIRILETTDPDLIAYMVMPQQQQSPLLTGLQSLTFRPGRFSMLGPWVFSRPRVSREDRAKLASFQNAVNFLTLKMALSINTQLRSLAIGEGCFWNQENEDVFLDLTLVLPTSTLERLHITFDHPPKHVYMNPDEAEDIFAAAVERYAVDRPPFDALKEITISAVDEVEVMVPRMVFLSRCWYLERIRLQDVDKRFLSLLPALLCTASDLTILEWIGGNDHNDEFIADLLRMSEDGWRVLRLPKMNGFGPLSFEVLMESAETLEELVVAHWGILDSSCFLDLLCAAERLRRLEGSPDRVSTYGTVGVSVHAYNAFLEHIEGDKDRTWALGPSMEFLQMRIEGVPRPDVVGRLSGYSLQPDPNGIDDSKRYDVQRWIYEQLGRMTGLRELVLGIVDQNLYDILMMALGVNNETSEVELEQKLSAYCTTFLYRCLEFSLESGLELLSGLKELEVLDVRSTAHRIGVAELEWMHVHWPKLKKVKGLYACRYWTGDAEEIVAWEDAVDEWMEAHPNGIGSSFE